MARIEGQVANFEGKYLHRSGPFIIDSTNATAFEIRKDGDGTTIFIIDTGDMIVSGSGAGIQFGDDVFITFGTGNDVSMGWETADPNAESFIIALGDDAGNVVPALLIGDQTIINKNFGVFDAITQPLVALVDADADSYIAFTFNADDVSEIRTDSPMENRKVATIARMVILI